MPHKDPAKRREYNSRYKSSNLERVRALNLAYKNRHKDEIHLSSQEYYQLHKDEINQKRREAYASNPEIRQRKYETGAIWRKANLLRFNELHRSFTRRRKLQILEAYGDHCGCCGETSFEFLSIDHINGGGTKERKQLFDGKRQGGFQYYSYLWKQHKETGEWPGGLQVLCHNCNMAKGFYGTCPHQSEWQAIVNL